MKKDVAIRLETVRRALRYWDPIGVIDNAEAKEVAAGEYDTYAPSILRAIESGAAEGDIALSLAAIRVDSMTLGKRRPTEREEDIGMKLAAWRDGGFEDEPDFRFTRYAF